MKSFGVRKEEDRLQARDLRKNETEAEKTLWEALRARRFMNLKFRRQHRIQIFIVDFFCHDLGLIIELDGAAHHLKEQIDHDANRDAYLKSLGYTVLRFPNQEIYEDIKGVLSRIEKAARGKEPNK